jgi:hypothetical protein
MKVASAKKRLLQLIKAKEPQLSSLFPADGIALMLAFYQDERADGCEIDEDGDMLLYQWGCYDWGQGESFEFNITRQFMDAAGEDEEIRQLSLTFKFKPSDSLRKLADGNRWCHVPDEIREFRSFIESSAAYKAVAKAKPAAVTLELQVAG